jgi:sortase A
MTHEVGMKFLRRLELLLLISGLLLLGVYIAARIHGTLGSQAELQNFREKVGSSTQGSGSSVARTQLKPDFSLWSSKRIEEYERSVGEYAEAPLAVLRISKVHLEVPVVNGTDDLSLNIGVGHIAGTVRPGEEGNIGIAGHRDGFFRVLKDVGQGDAIELQGPIRTDTYVVDRIVIVSTDDVSVLQRRSRPSLTLVTCYPFYFIGSAPRRYIIQASLSNSEPMNFRAGKQGNSESRSIKEAADTR